MAAEPAPPGPPDDRMDALEARVDALEDHALGHDQSHVQQSAVDAANFGIGLLHRDLRQLSDQATRIVQQQDQHDATLRDVVAGQQEQARILERLGGVMDRHGRVLEEHGEALGRLERALDGHARVLGEHSRALGEHGETLGRLERGLDGHARVLGEHGEALGRLERAQDGQQALLEEVLRRLPPAGE